MRVVIGGVGDLSGGLYIVANSVADMSSMEGGVGVI